MITIESTIINLGLGNLENWKVVRFYPYTSYTLHRIIRTKQHYFSEKCSNDLMIESIFDYFMKKCEDLGCKKSNKIVIEIEKIHTNDVPFIKSSNLFIGLMDGWISIGLGVWQSEAHTQNLNKKFN